MMARRRKPPRLIWRDDRGVWTLRHGDVRVSLATSDQEKAMHLLDLYVKSPGTFWSAVPSGGDVLSGKALRKAIYRALRGAQWRSTRRDAVCDLTLDDVDALIVEQGFCCAVSGLPFSDAPSDSGRRRPFAPSIDRIDNKAGYELGNVRVVASIVNLAMGDYGESEFLTMCEAVSRRNRTLVQKPNTRPGKNGAPERT